MIDFKVVSVGLEFAATTYIGLGARFDLAKFSSFSRFLILGVDVVGDELALVIDEPKLSAVGLDETGDKNVVMSGVEDMQKEAGFTVLNVERGRVDKGKGDIEASGVDNDVDKFTGVVGKNNVIAVEFFYIWFMGDVAVADMVKELRVDGRMTFEQFMIGFRKSVLLGFAQNETDKEIADSTADSERGSHFDGKLVENVGGDSEDIFGNVMIAAADAVEDFVGAVDSIDSNITTRIAGTDDENSFIGKKVGCFVVGGMEGLSVKLAIKLGIFGIPMVAVGDDEATIASGLAIVEGYEPATVFITGSLVDGCVEGDVVVEIEMVGIIA